MNLLNNYSEFPSSSICLFQPKTFEIEKSQSFIGSCLHTVGNGFGDNFIETKSFLSIVVLYESNEIEKLLVRES